MAIIHSKIKMFIIISLALFLLVPPVAYAEDNRTGNWNFNETTGLINMPTARVQKYRTMKFSIRMAKLGKNPPLKHKHQSADPGPHTGTIWDSDWWIDNDGDRRLLISPVKNVEINIMNVHSYSIAPVVGAKWVAVNETDRFPAIAIGCHNITGYDEDLNVPDPEVRHFNSKAAPFITASKTFFNDHLDLSVGYGHGRFRKRVFYGGELFLDKNHYLSAVGEFDGNIPAYGLKYRLPGDRWDFSYVIQDSKNHGFTFGYTIPW